MIILEVQIQTIDFFKKYGSKYSMDMKIVEKLVNQWFKLRPKYVDMIFAGRYFGGRHGESRQQPESFFCGADILRINFEPYEILTVYNPKVVSINQGKDLVIERASEIRFGWYYYGRNQISKNWCEDIYLNKKNYVEHISIFDGRIERKRMINDKEFLIELIPSYLSINGQ